MMDTSRKPKRTITGVRVVFEGAQLYSFPPEKVFPYLCPVREYEYIPSWGCDVVHLSSGFAEYGGVFTTKSSAGGDERDVWIISRYDRNRAIEFIRVDSLRCMIYTVELHHTADGGTQVAWKQIITGLTEEGNRHVQMLRQADFTAMLAQEQTLLQQYLRTSAGDPASH